MRHDIYRYFWTEWTSFSARTSKRLWTGEYAVTIAGDCSPYASHRDITFAVTPPADRIDTAGTPYIALELRDGVAVLLADHAEPSHGIHEAIERARWWHLCSADGGSDWETHYLTLPVSAVRPTIDGLRERYLLGEWILPDVAGTTGMVHVVCSRRRVNEWCERCGRPRRLAGIDTPRQCCAESMEDDAAAESGATLAECEAKLRQLLEKRRGEVSVG